MWHNFSWGHNGTKPNRASSSSLLGLLTRMETEDPSSNCQQGTDSAGLYSLIVFGQFEN